MTYVIPSESEDELLHYGVKGMRWGVRRETASGGSGGKTSSAKPRPKLTPEQRRDLGKQVTLAVLATAGGIGVASLAGPIAGTAVTAAIRGVASVKSISSDSSFDGGQGVQIKGRTSDGKYSVVDEDGRAMNVDGNILKDMLSNN